MIYIVYLQRFPLDDWTWSKPILWISWWGIISQINLMESSCTYLYHIYKQSFFKIFISSNLTFYFIFSFISPDTRPKGRKGSSRKIRLNLDPSQYYNDLKNGNDCYNSFNLVVRRDQKENNFKSVLSTIKELIAIESIGQGVPAWLSDILLGFGDPSAANYRYRFITY